MSQTIKCPKCNEIIDIDKQIREEIENEVRNENNEKGKQKLKNELMPQLREEAKNSVKFEHAKEYEKEKLRADRAEGKIVKMKETVDKATKPINQGSPEVDGEVQELVLENYLKNKFPTDNIIPVPKGKPGADCIQEIIENNTSCGKVLWESKDTETFQEKYVSKLNNDMSDNNIGFGVLAVGVLPKKIKEKFEFRENKKIILCKFDETLDVVSEMVRQYAITVTKAKKHSLKDINKSQNDLWKLFTSESFIIDFRNLLKTSIADKMQIESDKTSADKSYKKRINIWQDKKDHLTKIIRNFSQVEGTLLTADLISIQDGKEDE